MFASKSGRELPCYLIAVEKQKPFRCRVLQIVDETLNHARLENEAAIERLKQSVASDTWPTGYETLGYLALA